MNNTEILGLTLEIVFLALGVYLYLYSSGMIQARRFQNPSEVEKFRKQNGKWLRILSLLLVAIMAVNLWLRLMGK